MAPSRTFSALVRVSKKPTNGGRSQANLKTAHYVDEAQLGSLLLIFSEPEDFAKSVDSSEAATM
jgi:hypothetical protein